jgi:Ca-activated chloride channel family protein
MIEALPALHLLRPWWLLAWLPALLLGWHLLRRRASGSGWAAVIDRELLDALLGEPQQARSAWPLWLVITSWLLAVLALAGPSFTRNEQAALKQADALVVLLDLSPSMLAADVKPSRLQAAHYKLLDLLRARREGYTGLVAYAGSAHVVAPLSDDSNTIAALVTTLEPRIMPSVGSQVEDAVSEALQLLENSHFTRGRLLLLTDGVVPSAVNNIQRQLRGKAVELHVIGIGTAAGAPIELEDGSFLRDARGQVIIHQLDEEPLKQLASDNGGQYKPLQLDDSDIATLAAPPAWLTALGNGEQRQASHTIEHWQDNGYWFALPCLLLVLALFRRGALYCLLPLLVLVQPQPVRAIELPQDWQDWWLTPDQQGARALAAGDAATAAGKFANPQWKAYAEYQNGQHSEAAEHFASEDTAAAQYNRGNALAHTGDLQGAISAYDAALQQQPGLADASFNRELVKKLLEQQQKQQQQQQKQQQQGAPEDKQGEQQDAQQPGEQQQNGEQQQSGEEQQTGEQQQSGQQQQTGAEQQQAGEQKDGEQQDSAEPQQQAGEQPQDDKQQQAGAEQQQAGEQQDGEQSASRQPGSTAKPDAKQGSEQQGNAQADSLRRSEREKQQATEQWLRKVPDDPGGLLKNKFEYYYQQNRQEMLRQRRAGEQQQEEQRW